MDEDKRLGTLIGLAVGDALGTTLEFTNPPLRAFDPPLAGPHRAIVGGGPFGLAPGEVTDDTQMATCLYSSIRGLGRFDVGDVARRYLRWMATAFDIGNQTSASLRSISAGVSPLEAGRDVWLQSGKRAAGNGSLMRTAPIAVLLRDGALRRSASLADSAITHHDPRCRLACAMFNAAVAALSAGCSPAQAAEAALSEASVSRVSLESSDATEADQIQEAEEQLTEDLSLAAELDPMLYGRVHLLKNAGFVRVAFRLAFWELEHAPSFEEGLVDVVNRGGDADTNGAIAGALLGAHFGFERIPGTWRDAVLQASVQNGYHPKVFLES